MGMTTDPIPRPESIPGGERVPQLVAAYERARTAFDLYMAAYLQFKVVGVPKDLQRPVQVRTEADVDAGRPGIDQPNPHEPKPGRRSAGRAGHLTPEIIAAIKAAKGKLTIAMAAMKFDVSTSTISVYWRGERKAN